MSVSILIPAYRATFLRQAIASALTQEVEDLEILVSDDSGGDAVLPVVEQFRDPRIRYSRTAGRIGSTANLAILWGAARHDLIKYVFDDDVLMPHALAELLNQANRHPAASFYFGSRHIIDGAGRIVTEAPVRERPVFSLDGRQVAINLVPRILNPIGEFTNVLMNRKTGLTPELYLSYEGIPLHVMGDVAFYLGASRLGPAVGIKQAVASFRMHGDQQSSPAANPRFALGLAEWELFIRGERRRGTIDQAQATEGTDRLATIYADWVNRLPALRMLQPGLAELRSRLAAGQTDLLDAAFTERWSAFVATVLANGGDAPIGLRRAEPV